MKLFWHFAALCFMFLLSGCADIATLDFQPQGIQYSQDKIDLDLKSINVSKAPKDKRTGKIDLKLSAQYERNFLFTYKSALEDSIASSCLFSDEAIKKCNLHAVILKVETKGEGLVNFKTYMDVNYKIQDRKTGDILYDKIISSEGMMPFSENVLGAVRWPESRNICVKENIRQFIDDLTRTLVKN